mmetsp:Transcript_2522/g.6440  ORF Transcript_2522/g.6440 Transcript_2522/m.6440 type:complete len:183 (+) Transcript_2522:161-709(+)|eukprot:CAMPEP_0202362144 /NCGR_PEP_ID=MMETSP1126-20121109/14427_1 /ASSEMBLY_ACC=CAM_ASM_000457 /TAXON_ID=3047 /ORGANISM="Dunaliella tertiolecta, Strain CCMP1320" /LENGTH=182 /DNA_ID=CAMNT_0048956243 /DNA_START=134 /DNA_END=682 /DNA_ORIENTATION=+
MDELKKELKIRKRVAAIFNKREEDFPEKAEWDDYLETLEDIVYNLTNNIDVQQTEQRLVEYERANRASIISNQARLAEEARKVQLAAHGQAAAVVVDDKAVAAAGGPASYAPTMSAAPAMAAQPVPLKPAAMDGNGTLLPPPGTRPPPLTDQHPAALAAAWSPGLPRARALQEAFASLLLSS